MTDIDFPYFNPETPKQVGDNFRKIKATLKPGLGGSKKLNVRMESGGPGALTNPVASDEVIIFARNKGARTMSIPLAASNPGRVLYLKCEPDQTNVDSIGLSRSGADLFDRNGTLGTGIDLLGSITPGGHAAEGITLVSDGSSRWYQIGMSEPQHDNLVDANLRQVKIYTTNPGSSGPGWLLGSSGSDFTWYDPSAISNPHNLLSTMHPDTAAASVVRGDLVVGNATPKWSRLAKGASGTFLRANATDAAWSTIGTADLPTGIDHHANLTNFTANDDHTQYALLAGRSGGQTLIGGTASGDDITLQCNSSGAATAAMITLDLSFDWRHSINILSAAAINGQQNLFQIASTGTIGAAGAFVGMKANPVLTLSGLVAGTSFQFFSSVPTLTLDPAVATTNVNAPKVFQASGSVNLGASTLAYGNVQTAGLPWIEHDSRIRFNATSASATATMNAGVESFAQRILEIGAGWTMSYLAHSHTVAVAAGAGTITEHVAHDIDDLKTYPGTLTNAISIRSIGAAVTMRHAGPVIIGSIGAPNTTKGLDLTGDFATRATAITVSNGANNNLAIGQTSFVRLTGPTAVFSITGLTTGYDGKRVILYNATTQDMSITNEDAGSTAANRITTNTGGLITTSGPGAVEVFYDSTASRWIVIGTVL